MTDNLTLIDEHVVVACPVADAMTCLDGPNAIAGWFGARRGVTSTTIESAVGEFCLDDVREQRRPAQRVLIVDGVAGVVRCHGYLTLAPVIRHMRAGVLHHGTQIWVHVELAPANRAHHAAVIVRDAIVRGLEHLRLELDAES